VCVCVCATSTPTHLLTHVPADRLTPVCVCVCVRVCVRVCVCVRVRVCAQTAYSVLLAVCDLFCPKEGQDLLEAITSIHGSYRCVYVHMNE
jgi:hypothetical protein